MSLFSCCSDSKDTSLSPWDHLQIAIQAGRHHQVPSFLFDIKPKLFHPENQTSPMTWTIAAMRAPRAQGKQKAFIEILILLMLSGHKLSAIDSHVLQAPHSSVLVQEIAEYKLDNNLDAALLRYIEQVHGALSVLYDFDLQRIPNDADRYEALSKIAPPLVTDKTVAPNDLRSLLQEVVTRGLRQFSPLHRASPPRG